MIHLSSFKNIFLIPELRRRILFTLGVLFIDRLGLLIPVVGVDVNAIASYMQRATQFGGLMNYLDVVSGGSLSHATVFALGIGPYISASIMMQLLSMAIPALEAKVKEGEYGRREIAQYTRYLTVGLALFWSFFYAMVLERADLVLEPGWAFRIMFMVSLTAGSVFVMWLGEQITLHGIGNGSSMLIFAGIVARFPGFVQKTMHFIRIGSVDAVLSIVVLLFFILLAGAIVFLERGERKIPVQYARRVVGNKVYGGQSTYIPFKVNAASVMPVIFAQTVLMFPIQIARFLSDKLEFLSTLADPNSLANNIINTGLIIAFTYFYTAMIFNPEELAENLRKSGGFVPGIRPGRRTAEFFAYILNRIGLVGAIYLASLALIPNLVIHWSGLPVWVGGTALLICVGTALDTSAQMETYLIERRYEGFLSSGRLKGRTAR